MCETWNRGEGRRQDEDTLKLILLDVAIASVPMVVGLTITWRLIWPRWKVLGKVVAYLVGVAALSALIGHWSVLIGWLHQGVGIAFHIRFSRRHGFTWYAVENPERYVALSKEWVERVAAERAERTERVP